VLLGWRHPWEHGDGDHGGGQHHDESPAASQEGWDAFSTKALKMNDDDDDEDEEEDDDE